VKTSTTVLVNPTMGNRSSSTSAEPLNIPLRRIVPAANAMTAPVPMIGMGLSARLIRLRESCFLICIATRYQAARFESPRVVMRLNSVMIEVINRSTPFFAVK
jgi:hypothetical protein